MLYCCADFIDHETPIRAIALDSTGTVALSGAEDGTIYLWDLRSDSHVRRMHSGSCEEISALEFVPGSMEFFVASSDHQLRHFTATTGMVMESLDTQETLSTLRTDGHVIVAGGEESIVHVWDVREWGTELSSTNCASGPINALCITDGGGTVIAGLARGKENISVWKTT